MSTATSMVVGIAALLLAASAPTAAASAARNTLRGQKGFHWDHMFDSKSDVSGAGSSDSTATTSESSSSDSSSSIGDYMDSYIAGHSAKKEKANVWDSSSSSESSSSKSLDSSSEDSGFHHRVRAEDFDMSASSASASASRSEDREQTQTSDYLGTAAEAKSESASANVDMNANANANANAGESQAEHPRRHHNRQAAASDESSGKAYVPHAIIVDQSRQAKDGGVVVNVKLDSELQTGVAKSLKSRSSTKQGDKVEALVEKEKLEDIYIHDDFQEKAEADTKRVNEGEADSNMKA